MGGVFSGTRNINGAMQPVNKYPLWSKKWEYFRYGVQSLDGLNPHKGAGPDGILPKVLKALNSHIATVLARMFNLSLQTAQVPEDCRRAIVCPCYQKSPRNVFLPKAILRGPDP